MTRMLTLIAVLAWLPGAAAQHSHTHETASLRTVRVEMTDNMRFTPAEITVKRGEKVRFVPANKGLLMHEMVLGTLDELKKHAEAMRRSPSMPHDHAHMAHVAPGKSGELVWQFTEPGELYYACLIPGHFEAGMLGKVLVTK